MPTEPNQGPDSEFGTQPEPRPQPQPGRRRSRFSDADPASIGTGLVFFLIGGAYLLASGGHVTVNAGWTLSLLLVGLGLSGVVSALLRSRRDDDKPGRRRG